jgi:hypothetical protein
VLRHAQAQAPEQRNAVQVLAEGRGVLEAVDEAHASVIARALDIRRALDAQQELRMRLDLRFPMRDRLERILEGTRVAPDAAQGDIQRGQARSPRIREFGLGHWREILATVRPGTPEAVDHRRAAERRPFRGGHAARRQQRECGRAHGTLRELASRAACPSCRYGALAHGRCSLSGWRQPCSGRVRRSIPRA